VSLKRAAPLSGIAFVVFFLGSVLASMAPSDTASDKTWVAAYATHGKQAQHLLTGVLLVLAALSLISFLTHVWTRVAAASGAETVSPLPIVAAGVAAACIAVGGVLMAGISGTVLIGSAPLPRADLLRFGNDVGFAMVALAGMLATALSIASMSVQARAAGVFGTRLWRFSLVVAVALIASLAFLPILALLVWLIVVTIALRRSDTARATRTETVKSNEPVVIRT
jgi:MFS family permease